MGLKASDFAADAVDVWPDNLAAIEVFVAMSTQWRVGPGGVYGLDYNVMYRLMDRLGLSHADYDEMEHCLRTLEDAALEQMRKK